MEIDALDILMERVKCTGIASIAFQLPVPIFVHRVITLKIINRHIIDTRDLFAMPQRERVGRPGRQREQDSEQNKAAVYISINTELVVDCTCPYVGGA